MEGKKVSFGFSRVQKKQQLVAAPKEEKKEMIECLEGKSIKIKDLVEEEEKPLIIPLKNKSTTAASISQIADKIAQTALKNKQENPPENEEEKSEIKPPISETLEQQAARELLEDVKKVKKEEVKVSTIPIAGEPTLTGEKEPTLDDYEAIPIADFGLAMLRGMGWQPGKGIGKKNESVDLSVPNVRPKGMGLGADKVAKTTVSSTSNGSNEQKEELKIVKGAYIKIVSGKKSGSYGQISGFDEDSGRLIAKMAISGENLNLSEFMLEAVTKDEFNRSSRVLNSAKYEIYKRKDDDDRRRKDARRNRH